MAMISEERVEFNKQHMHRMIGYTDSGMENPVTIQDKLRWLNIYDADPIKSDCADKLKVKEFARRVTGDDLGVPTLKVWNSADEVNFDGLPEKFVLKCNHGSGMNIIVKDKNTVNIEEVRSQLGKWMNQNFAFRNGFESHYHWIDRKVFAEELISIEHKEDIPDYKFLCFNGRPEYMQIISDRNNKNRRLNYYDIDIQKCTISRIDFPANYNEEDILPKHFIKMKEYAELLSNWFKFVRVDLYEVNNRIYLGELTFTPGAFAFRYRNPEDEIKVGNLLTI